MDKQIIVSVRLSENLKAKLQAEAATEHRSFSQHVAKILSDHVETE